MSDKSTKYLRECFLGEVVILYLKNLKIATSGEDGEPLQIGGLIEGLLVEVDADFFYLGDQEGNVERAVARDTISIIEIANLMDQMIAAMGSGVSDDDVH